MGLAQFLGSGYTVILYGFLVEREIGFGKGHDVLGSLELHPFLYKTSLHGEGSQSCCHGLLPLFHPHDKMFPQQDSSAPNSTSELTQACHISNGSNLISQMNYVSKFKTWSSVLSTAILWGGDSM